MSYFNNVVSYLEVRRDRALKGLYNCIPLPFTRFKEFLPGTQMGKYVILTANQKVGKTKFCDFVYVYEVIDFLLKYPKVKAKILYFCLEESPRKKYIEFLSHLLYKLDKIHMSNADLETVDKDRPLSKEVLDLLHTERYQSYINKFEETVEYIDNISNPTGINKKCREYALEHGHLNFKKAVMNNPMTNKPEERDIIDVVNPYTPDDPEEYRIVILDNYSNLTLESGLDLWGTIMKMSKYFVTLRDQLNYTIIAIQHQAQAKEGNEAFKLNRIKPTSDGLGDCKLTSRDANMVIGLYSPFKYGLTDYEGYDIMKFRNHIRFMEVIEDRDYGANGNICPLYFDGAVSFFSELPKSNDSIAIGKVYKFMEENKKRKSSIFMMMVGKITKLLKK